MDQQQLRMRSKKILTVDVSLALSIQHIALKQTFINNHITLDENSRVEFNDKIGPATITHVIEEKF